MSRHPEAVPEFIGEIQILAVELVSGRRRAAQRMLTLCTGCTAERWTTKRQLLKSLTCRVCANESRALHTARLSPGQQVGFYTVLSIKRRAYAGFMYEVQDNRCGHVNEVNDAVRHEFKGKKSLCECPLRYTEKSGYIRWQWRMPDGRRVILLEHRMVMAGMLKRELYAHENPHHKNGVKDDNCPENLELWSTFQPAGQRIEDKTAWAIKWLEQYLSPEEKNSIAQAWIKS
jgi:hypothetical protein